MLSKLKHLPPFLIVKGKPSERLKAISPALHTTTDLRLIFTIAHQAPITLCRTTLHSTCTPLQQANTPQYPESSFLPEKNRPGHEPIPSELLNNRATTGQRNPRGTKKRSLPEGSDPEKTVSAIAYLPLSSNTFTGAVGWGASGWKEQFLGMGCRMGAD